MILDEACAIARAGLRTCFTHSIAEGGGCTCGRPTCGERSWGKHPISKAWQRVATDDVEALKAQFDGLRFEPNISVVLGPQSDGRYIVSIDNDDAERFAQLLEELGPLPETLSGRAPRGLRTFFALPADAPRERVKNITGIGGEPGVDLKAAGGQVVVRGRNASGDYTDFDPTRPIAELPPAWTLAILAPPRPPPDVHQYTPHTLREDERAKRRYQKYLERAVVSECSLLARAQEGQRNSTAFQSAFKLFSLANGMHLPAAWSYVRSEVTSAAEASGLSRAEAAMVVANAEKAVEKTGAIRMPREAPPPGVQVAAEPPEPSSDIKLIDDNGQPARIAENVARMLALYPRGIPRMNMLVGRPEWPDGSAIDDADELELQGWLVARPHSQRVRVGIEAVHGGILLAATRTPWEPIQAYLQGLVWDGVPRLETFAESRLGAVASTYASNVVRCFFVGAVARAMVPGCQMDTMIVLEGKQGLRKTSALRALAGDAWFSSSQLDIGKQPDCYQKLNGVWIYELGEVDGQLASAKKQQEIKAYLTDRVDNYRPSYGRNTITRARRNVFVGTTNATKYLVDDTGARRYHGLACGDIDLEGIRGDRDQLWAEAVTLYRQGVPWWLDVAASVEAAHEAELRYTADPWEDKVRALLEPRERVTTGEILDLLAVDRSRQDRAMATRVGVILRRLGGWRKVETGSERGRFEYRRDRGVG